MIIVNHISYNIIIYNIILTTTTTSSISSSSSQITSSSALCDYLYYYYLSCSRIITMVFPIVTRYRPNFKPVHSTVVIRASTNSTKKKIIEMIQCSIMILHNTIIIIRYK